MIPFHATVGAHGCFNFQHSLCCSTVMSDLLECVEQTPSFLSENKTSMNYQFMETTTGHSVGCLLRVSDSVGHFPVLTFPANSKADILRRWVGHLPATVLARFMALNTKANISLSIIKLRHSLTASRRIEIQRAFSLHFRTSLGG